MLISEKPSNFRDKTNVDWAPSVNLGKDPEKELKKAASAKARQERRAARKFAPDFKKPPRSSRIVLCQPSPEGNAEITDLPASSSSSAIEPVIERTHIPEYNSAPILLNSTMPKATFAEIGCQTDISGEDLDKLNSDILQLKNSESALQLEMAKLNLKVVKTSDLTEEVLSKNDKLVVFYTGLINFHVLITFYNFVEKNVAYDSAKNAIPKFCEFLIMLIKLRLNVPFKDLGYRFNIHDSTVSRIFARWINGIYETCKKLIIWPERDVRQNSMPSSFRKAYGNRVAAIIDCFEIFTVQPSGLIARSETWSHYKNHNTVKYLISIAPQGFVNFVSEGFCGRVSDKQITDDCNFSRYLIPGDLVLADRGFRVAELLEPINAHLEIPAFTKGLNQLSYKDCSETRELANVRIHVERMIGLLRNKYPILTSVLPLEFINTKPDQPIPLIDKIVVICCALVNICPPIVKE
jgi:hypothetical protein